MCENTAELYLRQADLKGITCTDIGFIIEFNEDIAGQYTDCSQILHKETYNKIGNKIEANGTTAKCSWKGVRLVHV